MAVDTILDGVVRRVLLWAVPRWVRPNHITMLRLVASPVAAILYLAGHLVSALLVFAGAALLDLVDGALARTRGPITRLGLLLDPLADKLLVGLMLYCAGRQYLVVRIMLVFVALEAVVLLVAFVTDRRVGLMARANLLGKAKMWCQSIGIGLLVLAALLTGGAASGLGRAGSWVLWTGLGLGLASAVLQLARSPLCARARLLRHRVSAGSRSKCSKS